MLIIYLVKKKRYVKKWYHKNNEPKHLLLFFFCFGKEPMPAHKMYYMHMNVYTNVPLILPLKFKVPQTSVGLKCLNYGDASVIFKDLV